MAKRCFFSFHYAEDVARAAQVRNIGSVEGNRLATDNEWETITRGGEIAIRRWIAEQLHGKSCTIVLVGAYTASRPWVIHEIVESWNAGKGVAGIRIHGLKNLQGQTSLPGPNPFDTVTLNRTGARLSSIVPCYDPIGWDSRQKYAWITQSIEWIIEEAIRIRNQN